MISAIASEIFYPFFVLQSLPANYDEHTFRMDNMASLFPIDSIITRDLIIKYAKKIWGFESEKTITLALRILKQAEILDSVSVAIGSRHTLSYFPRPRIPHLETFIYCLYEEPLYSGASAVQSLDRIQNGDFAKLFLLNRLQIDSLLKTAEKEGFICFISMPGSRHVKLLFPSLEDLVDKLVS
ncbi:MAG: hypothetical protein K6T99_10430 [Armatimonadetes bacterium]|nr:hypothetical protein [Armatimonadota bacterium]